jgi:hypothetical protein
MDSMYDVHHTALNASIAQAQGHTHASRIDWFGVNPHRAYNRDVAEPDASGQES